MTADHTLRLLGRRLALRPLVPEDFEDWRDVRLRCADWLLPWEPRRSPGQPDVVVDRDAFVARCRARDRDRDQGTGHGFAIEVDGHVRGEINLNNIVRGAFQNAHVGYWIDQELAGRGYVPEGLVVALRYAFEDLGLHRVQIAIVPRNERSHRVVDKLGLRNEGVAERYLEINGVWEDHVRYAITAEEWMVRRNQLLSEWVLTG